MNRTIIGIQYLRGIAAVAVVIVHTAVLEGLSSFDGRSILNSVSLGNTAVQLFFVISGFIIVIVSLDGDLRAKLSVRDFAWRRFARIMPFMWLCILAYNLLSLAGTGGFEVGPFLRAMFPWPEGDVKPGVVWTLRLELIFYAVFAVTLLMNRRGIWLLAIWALLPLVFRIAGLVYPSLADSVEQDSWVWVLVMGHQVGANVQFGAGMLLGAWWLKRGHGSRGFLPFGYASLSVMFACVAAVAEAMAILLPPDSDILQIVVTSALLAGVVAMGLLHDKRPSSFGQLLGDASYSIYLTHVMALLVVAFVLEKSSLQFPTIVTFVGLVAAAVAAGVVVHKLVEVPLIELTKRVMASRLNSSRPAHRPSSS